MAQLAIPLLLVGTAYLVSNDSSKKEEKEAFSDLTDEKNQGNLLANQNDDYSPNISESQLNINNSQENSAYQDKYFMNAPNDNMNNESTFQTLAGETKSYNDIKHNNMNIYYNNKSNGFNNLEYSGVLDSYTGQGTFDIKKEEVGSFFKPCNDLQNVYGNQNQNDFLQSRVNSSLRRANQKPFESIQDTPGLCMDYNEKSNLGFNNGMMNRDQWKPKSVDELRTENNPKMSYKLDDHMGPASSLIQNVGVQGKVIKKTPETFFENNKNLGMIAGSIVGKNTNKHMSEQNINEQNRDSTTVSYYGAKGPGDIQANYVSGDYQDPHKQQLPSAPFINLSANEINPTNESNYGKKSYNALPNNRSTTRSNYFGTAGKIVSNVIKPIINGVRHTKKTNFEKNKDLMGNVSGNVKRTRAKNPYDNLPTTNREMYECKLNMNHLNVQKQDATAYMNANPLVETTNRSTMNQTETGPAMRNGAHANKSYSNVYNQRNNDKLYACDVKSGGNMDLFNSNISMRKSDKESCNNRQTPFYNPQNQSYGHPTDVIGQFNSMPQEYECRTNDYLDSSMLNAFKNNPYTQSLNSVA